jgi:uncharacterized protein (TIGR02594 family)
MIKPAWIVEAEKHLGQREIKGPQHNPWIVKLWKLIKRGGIKDDETPWCAAFVGGVLEACGIQSTRFESAGSYKTFGYYVPRAVYGCIVVFSREGGGHVGFVVGKDSKGRLLVLGGNQSNQVSIAPFDLSRVVAYRWPVNYLAQSFDDPPLVVSSAASSTNEA